MKTGMRKCALFTLVLLCLVGSLSVSFAAPKNVFGIMELHRSAVKMSQRRLAKKA